MKIQTASANKLVITDVKGLDPIHVYVEDIEPGRGSIVLRCFDRAWHAYWGAMGDKPNGDKQSVMEFLTHVSPGYVAGCLARNNLDNQQSELEEQYLDRISAALIDAAKQMQPKPTKAQLERQERVDHANALIQAISNHGRRFFWSKSGQKVAQLSVDTNGKIWWTDDYQGTRVCIEKVGGYEHRWRGFSHGGTLKNLVQMMRDYIKTGQQIHFGYVAQECWGYDEEATLAVQNATAALPILRNVPSHFLACAEPEYATERPRA